MLEPLKFDCIIYTNIRQKVSGAAYEYIRSKIAPGARNPKYDNYDMLEVFCSINKVRGHVVIVLILCAKTWPCCGGILIYDSILLLFQTFTLVALYLKFRFSFFSGSDDTLIELQIFLLWERTMSKIVRKSDYNLAVALVICMTL